ncbi:MAG: permease-like cell division protein FtsX [bacterium]|nr:permease-like cell division protein FtsX [bacterium]
MLTSFIRVIVFAARNFWRNIWLSVITVSMLVLTLLSVNVLVVLQVLGGTAVRAVESRIDVTASFVPNTTPDIVGEVRSYLLGLPQVVSVKTITAEEALEAFKERHKQNLQLLRSVEEVEGNPFGATLVIRARSVADYPFILEALENPSYRPYIQNKNFADHAAIIARITHLTAQLQKFGIILASIFAAIAVLIVFNTIRVAIYTYREEIGIMKLVGASPWFIRAPFLVEGIFYSVVAVAITALLVFPMLTVIEPYLRTFFEGTEVGLTAYFWRNFFTIFGLECAALILLNTLSSSFAVGRYLKS